MNTKETGIDGNCPTWPGASKVYSAAYKWMEDHGPDHQLIEALGKGDEELIKGIMLENKTREFYGLAD